MKYPLFFLTFALLVLTSCNDLETEYAATSGDSINGVRVLRASCARAVDLRSVSGFGKRLEPCDTLIHVMSSAKLPSVAQVARLRSWLEERQRQAVLVLRDGDLTQVLGTRWRDEARAGAVTASVPSERERLKKVASRLETLIKDWSDERLAPDAKQYSPPLLRIGVVPHQPEVLTGVGAFAHLHTVPVTLRIGSDVKTLAESPVFTALAHRLNVTRAKPRFGRRAPKPDESTAIDADEMTPPDELKTNDDALTLLRADDLPLVVTIPIGDDSRLLIVTNATALLDCAQADPAARALTAALVSCIADFDGGKKAAWLSGLEARDEEPQPPNLLALLLTTPPFSWAVIHVLALGAVFVWLRWAWLGRMRSPDARAPLRLRGHLDALGRQLERTQGERVALAALAKHHHARPAAPDGTAAVPRITTIDDAIAAAQTLHAASPSTSSTNAPTLRTLR